MKVELRNRAGVLTNPDTIQGWIQAPDADMGTALVWINKSVGKYEAVYVPEVAGEHWWRVETTGPVKVVEEKKLVVEEQNVLLPFTPPNLFVRTVQPALADLEENSLWIPVVDGAPLPSNEWEVYTGLGAQDNIGNLFIQIAQPVPTVDSLWIPMYADGTVKYITDWEVFTGLGSDPTNGNRNLYISAAKPNRPIPGSLWIALNNDLSLKTPDNWMVFV